MKTMTKIVTMMFIVAFASYANAATEIDTKDGKISVDGDKISINTKPNAAPAKAGATKTKVKKKVSGKKKKKSVQPTPEPTQVPIEEAKKNLAELVNTGMEITPVGNSVTGTASVTKTAKNKSKSSSVNIKIDLFGIFMPKKLTGTAREDHLSLSGVMNNNTSLKTENSVNGINTVSEPSSANFAGAARAKLGPVALDYQPMEVKRPCFTYVKGAPIGQVDIYTSNKIMLELYAFEKFLKEYDSGLTLGVGYEYSRVEGNLMIGLGKVANEGGGWSSVYRATYWYYYNDRVSVFIGLEKEDVRLTNKFMSAGLDKTSLEGGPFAGVNIGLF